MTTPEKIEELLKPYGLTLKDLPAVTPDDWAYEPKERTWAMEMVKNWTDGRMSYVPAPIADFICHQSDVIELLVKALSMAKR